MEKLFVIKIGGNVIDNNASLQSFLLDFAEIKAKKILVHGGGKIATKIGDQLGIESKYINGRRITDEATINLVTMVYGGLVNKKIVAKLQALNCNAIGLTGADANIIPATKRPITYPPLEVEGKDGIEINNTSKDLGSSNNSPLGDGGSNAPIETGSSNNSPLASGDGGKNGIQSTNFAKEIGTLNNSLSGDGGRGGIDYGFVGDINSAT